MRALTLTLLFSLIAAPAPGDEKESPKTATPESRVRDLRDQYDAAFQGYLKASRAAVTKEERDAAATHPGRNPGLFVPGFMKLAREFPGTEAAEDALVWVGSHRRAGGGEPEEAMLLLLRDHIRSAKLAPVLAYQFHAPLSDGAEKLLRGAIDQNPDRRVQGLAAYWLGQVLKERAKWARNREVLEQRFANAPEKWRRGMEQAVGPGWMDRVRRANANELDREAESLFLRVAKEFGDIPHNDKRNRPGLLRDAALANVREFQSLSIGKLAPEIEGTDLEGKPFRLSAYRGRVVVLEFGSHFF